MYTQTHHTCTYTYTNACVCAHVHTHTPTHPPHAHMTNYLFETSSIIHLAIRVPSLHCFIHHPGQRLVPKYFVYFSPNFSLLLFTFTLLQ